jgi:hypothetical protein
MPAAPPVAARSSCLEAASLSVAAASPVVVAASPNVAATTTDGTFNNAERIHVTTLEDNCNFYCIKQSLALSCASFAQAGLDFTKEKFSMANSTKPLKPSIIVADRESLAALNSITDYAPANSTYKLDALTALQTDADNKTAAAARAEAEAKSKRDDAVASVWAFHNGIVGMRDSVGAQYGKDSNEFQSVGRKKTTEYKKPTRKPKKSGS